MFTGLLTCVGCLHTTMGFERLQERSHGLQAKVKILSFALFRKKLLILTKKYIQNILCLTFGMGIVSGKES